MQFTRAKGFEGGILIGQRQLDVFWANGPLSYANPAGDPVSGPPNIYFDYIAPTMTVSKNFEVRFFPTAVNTSRATWTAKWYTVAGAEVVNGTNLSAEQIQTMAIDGEF